MSFVLKVTESHGPEGHTAQVEIIDNAGEVRADVYVEVYNGVPRLVVTPAIVERDSDDPTRIIDLLTDADLPR